MTTFEELTARRKQDAITAKAVEDKIVEVFRLLKWKPERRVDREYPLGHNGPQVYVSGRDGDKEITASANTYGLLGRVAFRAQYPKGDYYERDLPRIEITCSLEKDARQLAADISRRMLKAYDEAMVTARAKLAQANAYKNNRDSNLAAVLGRALTEREKESGLSSFDGLALGAAWGDAQASGDSVTLRLHSLPVALAVKIIALVRKEAKS